MAATDSDLNVERIPMDPSEASKRSASTVSPQKSGAIKKKKTLSAASSPDLPNAMNAAEITDKLGLHSLRHRNWYI